MDWDDRKPLPADSVFAIGAQPVHGYIIVSVQKPRKPYLAGPMIEFDDSYSYLQKHSDFRKKMMESDNIIVFHPAQGDDMKEPMTLADNVPFEMGMPIWSGPISNPIETKTSAETHEIHSFYSERGPVHYVVPKGFPRYEDRFLYLKHVGKAINLASAYSSQATMLRIGTRKKVGGLGLSLRVLKKSLMQFGGPDGALKDVEDLLVAYNNLASKVGEEVDLTSGRDAK